MNTKSPAGLSAVSKAESAMRVALGKFTSWGIQEHFGSELAATVRAALLHYARRLKSKSPPVGYTATVP